MEKRKKNRIKSIIALVCIGVLVILLAVFPMLASSAVGNKDAASILSGTVREGSVTRKILGGGTLTEEDATDVTVPAEVRLTEFLVKNGTFVKEGDPIARADRTSVMQAISQIQETMDLIAEDIEKESDKSNSDTVTAKVDGTVKLLYATEGASVQDVMLQHGALAVLSVDGKLAVDLPSNANLSAGTEVTVTLESGTKVSGKIFSNLDGTMVISIQDEGYEVGQTVSVTDGDGKTLGSGKLYIQNPWKAVAYSGTVEDINIRQGSTVSSGKTLMTLEDTGFTAAYQQLCSEYREYEDMMLELFQMYQTETVTAPCDGVVSGVDEDSALLLSDMGGRYTLSLLANAPFGEDPDALYYNYAGQVTALGQTEWTMLMDPTNIPVADYLDLTALTFTPETMLQEVFFPMDLVPVYENIEGVWQQLDKTQIMEKDILLIACDALGTFVWAVRVQTEEAPTGPSDPSDPTDPSDPSAPADPSLPTDPSNPGGYPGFSGGSPNWSGSFPSVDYSSLYPQAGLQQETPLYPLDTATLASVTPQNTVTVDISVDQSDMAELYRGQKVTVTVDALPGVTYEGAIESLGNSGTGNGGSSKFTVTVQLPRQENMLAGMQASVSVPLESVQNVLTIPVAALAEEGNKTLVYTGYDEENQALTDPVAVTTGLSDGENVQILAGLTKGQTFYYAYYDTLQISNIAQSDGFSMF